jgi:hypothetical protein
MALTTTNRSPSSAPPLSVGHLLLLVTCSAVYLGIVRSLIRRTEPTPIGLAIMVAFGLCIAGAWSVLAVLLWRCVRGRRWTIEPGLWLGAALGLRLAVDVLLRLPSRPLFRSNEAVIDGVTCLFLVVPLFSRDLPRHWKGIVTLLLALYGVTALSVGIGPPADWLVNSATGLALLEFGHPVAVIVLLAGGIWLDRRHRTPHTWLHRFGLALWIYYVLLLVLLRLF